jgi:hypothetical protein
MWRSASARKLSARPGAFPVPGGGRIHAEYTLPRFSKPWYKKRQTDFEYAAHWSLSFSHLPSRPQVRGGDFLPFRLSNAGIAKSATAKGRKIL